MPDYCMCEGQGCSVRLSCKRHISTPSEGRQSWFMGIPGYDENCPYFWPVKTESESKAEIKKRIEEEKAEPWENA